MVTSGGLQNLTWVPPYSADYASAWVTLQAAFHGNCEVAPDCTNDGFDCRQPYSISGITIYSTGSPAFVPHHYSIGGVDYSIAAMPDPGDYHGLGSGKLLFEEACGTGIKTHTLTVESASGLLMAYLDISWECKPCSASQS